MPLREAHGEHVAGVPRIRAFAAGFNDHWLLERHGYRTPAQARETLRQAAMA